MRAWILGTALALVGIAAANAENGFGAFPGPAEARPFMLGKLSLVALHDAQYVVPNDNKVFGADQTPEAVAAVLKASGVAQDRITLSVSALVVRTGKRVVLLDSGLGPKVNGALQASLKTAGLSAEAITDVVITHSHGDHIGGLVDGEGKLAFPKATIRMTAAEWTYMKGQAGAAEVVKGIDGHVETFAPGTEIAPGITAVALDGHTPGHVGYEIASGGKRLLDIGDLAHSSVLSLAKPDWTMGFDSDAAVAKATRKTTFARLAHGDEFVFAPHFPFPGVGHIVAAADGYRWMPGTP